MDETWPDEGMRKAKRARYSDRIDEIRRTEYPMLTGTTYLDHAATTPAPTSLLSAFSREFTQNLFGNPHSCSQSSQLSTRRIDDTRLRILKFFNADPTDFDVVFVANATAGIKLVADAFRDCGEEYGGSGFQYIYHNESHTSLVGVREMAKAGARVLTGDNEVNGWLSEQEGQQGVLDGQDLLQLFAYPGQSNMNGHRPDPQRRWCERIRNMRSPSRRTYSLFDAAGLVSTSPLDLSGPSAPDFTVLSFYKIFGFPDLGALIVRRDSGQILNARKYFGGGTVEMVINGTDPWHSKKISSFHDPLEDGTLPFHSIVALQLALDVHERIYGSMQDVATHTANIAQKAAERLSALRHGNGCKVCKIFIPDGIDPRAQGSIGPIIAFNLRNNDGSWIGKSEVEKLATVKSIQLRTGTLCNPGGTAAQLGLTAAEMRKNFSQGQRCGDEHDLMDGKPTGVLRISFGAMSSMADVDNFIDFVTEFYVTKETQSIAPVSHPNPSNYFIESLCVFPIKSCAGFQVPTDQRWKIHPEGLAWDREWCLVHEGTGSALSQKRYPQMALLRPQIDLKQKVLRILHSADGSTGTSLDIPLSRIEEYTKPGKMSTCTKATVSKICGDDVEVQLYTSPAISRFFTDAVGVPCTLARFPPRSTSIQISRPIKLRPPQSRQKYHSPASRPSTPTRSDTDRSILLSNESPILLVSRSSVNHLNEHIKASSGGYGVGKAVPANSFRGNIVVAQDPIAYGTPTQHAETPYAEDNWTSITINSPAAFNVGRDSTSIVRMDVLGPCQRCQMVCVDQKKGERHSEPYSTLAKTRRWDGKVWFGVHLCPVFAPGNGEMDNEDPGARQSFVQVGDIVSPL